MDLAESLKRTRQKAMTMVLGLALPAARSGDGGCGRKQGTRDMKHGTAGTA